MTGPGQEEGGQEGGQGAGIAAVVLALVSFSWGFIIVKLLPLEAAPIAAWRLGIGASSLVLAAAVLRVPWPRAWRMPVLAGLAFAGHQLLFIEAAQRTSIAIVTLVGALQPLVVAAVSRRTVGEAVSRGLLACSALAVAGVGVVVWASVGQAERTLLGDVLAVGNLLVFSGYFLFTKRSRQEGTPTLTLTASLLLVAFVVILPLALLGDGRLAPTAPELGLLAVLALVPGNGHLLVNWAHQRVSAALASLLLSAVPVAASLWAYLVLGEAFGPRHLVGMALVLVASEGGRRIERRTRLRRIERRPGTAAQPAEDGARGSTIPAMTGPRVQLFGLAKSKATRKAQRFFSERRVDVHFVDCERRPPSPGELSRFVQRFGVEALLDPTSKAYREQGLQYVSASDEDWIERMSRDPAILALPLGRLGQELTVGDDPTGWQRLAEGARG